MINVKAKLWLEGDSGFVLGEGRAELLRKVKGTGSLAAAARSMDMSYSHAWSDVRAMSGALGGPVITTSTGGRRGGGSTLTALGERMLRRFDEEEARLERHLAGRNKHRTCP
jgi:molybdate transport system regulatory protein